MSRYNWNRLISDRRIPDRPKTANLSSLRSEVESDYYRIINSASFRRLQDKTQVFPLDRSDFVRTRLTHSLEVSAIAKFIGKQVCAQIIEQQLEEEEINTHDIVETLACASLLHDIGNPPFGHFGESAIQNWFSTHLQTIAYDETQTLYDVLSEQQRNDLCFYEGNAQSLRIVTRLHRLSASEGMHLTSGVLDTILKYPCSSSEKKRELQKPKEERSLLRKKHSYFYSERDIYETIKNNTGTSGGRNPLTFILEAADDLAYTFSDLEDGYNKGLYTYGDLCQQLTACGDQAGLQRLEKLLARCQADPHAVNDPYRSAVFNWLTVKQLYCISEASKAFIAHYEAIMQGTFEQELLAVCSEAAVIRQLKRFAFDRVYQTRSIIKLELMGNEIISFLLERFVDALLHFDSDRKQNEIQEKYCRLLSPNYIECYHASVKDLTDDRDKVYYRLLLAADFIAGMTDTYAKTLYQEIKGIGALR